MLVRASALLALAAALGYAVQAVGIEYGLDVWSRDTETPSTFAAALVSIAVATGLFWVLFGLFSGPVDWEIRALAPFVVAGFLNPAIFQLLYFRGIDTVGASVSAAIVAANPAFATIVAFFLVDEPLGVGTLVGMGLIVVGAVVIQFVQNSDDPAVTEDAILRRLADTDPRDLFVPLAAAAFLGTSYVLIDVGLTGFQYPIAGTAVAQTAAAVVFLVILVVSADHRRQSRIGNRRALFAFAGAGGAFAFGWVANFFALESGTAVAVIALAGTFPFFVLTIQYARARQLPRSYRVIAAVATIVAGAVLLQVL